MLLIQSKKVLGAGSSFQETLIDPQSCSLRQPQSFRIEAHTVSATSQTYNDLTPLPYIQNVFIQQISASHCVYYGTLVQYDMICS